MNLPLEAGAFLDDSAGREAEVRAGVAARVSSGQPLYPDRSLDLQFAAICDGVRGFPVAAICLANLAVGESFPLNGKRYVLQSRGKRLVFRVEGSERVLRVNPNAESWAQFERDVEGVLLGHQHGCDAGDLVRAWQRDPMSRYPSAA